MKKLNAAVIGVGSMGSNHARVYAEIKNTNLVAVSDTNEELSAEIARTYNCESYPDYRNMLKNEDIDLLTIAVPTSLHTKVAMDCINARKHILIEKPIADTIANGKKIITAAAKNKIKLMVGHVERFNPAIIELKRRLHARELGKIFEINTTRIGPFPKRIRDVGVVIDLATHDIDVMQFLLESKIKRLYAETERKIHTDHEDLLTGLLKFENNILGVMNVNWLTPEKIREVTVTGEKGMFLARYLTQELYFYENVEAKKRRYSYSDIIMGVAEGNITHIRIKKYEPLKAELEAFVESIIKNKKPPVTGEDSLKTLEIARKIVESSSRNRVINL